MNTDQTLVKNTPPAPAAWDEEPADEAAAGRCLKNPLWRLHHLYRVADRMGRDVPFRMNAQQLHVARAIYEQGVRRVAILKARQLGFSTLFALMGLDTILWGEHKQACLCADTAENAKKLLRAKVHFAYDRLPEGLTRGAGALRRSEDALVLENGGALYATTRVRGGTHQFLHVSELGKIAHKDPERARELKTGAFPSVGADGVIAVESTFEGGKGGVFYELLKAAMETPSAQRTALDFAFFFFPWHDEKAYALDTPDTVLPEETRRYFHSLSAETGKVFSVPQMRWHARQSALLGADMPREFPSTAQEAFEANVEGSIYGEALSRLRAKGRIVDFEWDRSLPVHTFWDIGWGDTTAIWWVQFAGREIHFIDFYESAGEPCAHYARHVLSKPYGAPSVYLPHDAAATEKGSGLSYRQQLAQAGLVRAQVVPRTPDVWIGINRLRLLLERAWFHKTHCARGIDCLEAYHKKRNAALGVFEEVPVHDWASNAADAARYAAEALESGLLGKADASPEARRALIKTLPHRAVTGAPRR